MSVDTLLDVHNRAASCKSEAIDVIAVLRSGRDVAMPVWDWLTRHDVQHRQLLLCPQPSIYFREKTEAGECRIYSPMSNDRNWYRTLQRKGLLGSASESEFYDNFDLRFNHYDPAVQNGMGAGAVAEPGNVALLVDDVFNTGKTMQRCIDELASRGYEHIYFCAVKPKEGVWRATKNDSYNRYCGRTKVMDVITDGSIAGPGFW